MCTRSMAEDDKSLRITQIFLIFIIILFWDISPTLLAACLGEKVTQYVQGRYIALLYRKRSVWEYIVTYHDWVKLVIYLLFNKYINDFRDKSGDI